MGITSLLLIMALVGGPPPADQPVAKKAPVEVLHTEVDAVGWVFDASLKYDAETRPFMRFVYLPPWADAEWIGVLDYAVNSACGHGSTLVRGQRHAGGWLIGYDLRTLAPDPKQLARLISVWDGLAKEDPFFHVPKVNVTAVDVTCPHCKGGGKLTYTRTNSYRQRVQVVDTCEHCKGTGKAKGSASVNAVFLAPHLGEALAKHATNAEKSERIDVLVTELTVSTGAVYRADWLLEQLLTSARGKYPEFRQIDFKVDKFTPLDAHLQKRGYFIEQAQAIGGDKGAVLLISDVTGKGRIVLVTFGLGGRQPMIITYDFKDNRVRPDQQFIRNLVEFQPFSDANEVFVPMRSGLIEYLLTDAKGNFQRVAPPDVVADSTKPDGHTKELEMGMSCIMCHSPQDGYKTARNDLEFLMGADTDFIGEDFSYTNTKGELVKLTRTEVVDLVAGRYGERIDEPDGIIGRARRDYVRAVSSLTDYRVTADGPSSVQQLGAKLKSIYHSYRYARIDANKACLELGVRVNEGDPKQVLRTIVPPNTGAIREDVLISLLRNGAEIKRDDFDAIYGEMARRSVVHRKQYAETKK